ncbi:YgdI/YgdR family lipoprotein [Neptunomonas japonica]|nr:YgdI/YgdR family lipoprotein [Neptunomonas japonica]
MIKRILLSASLGFALLMTGCASPQKMAFNDESEVVEKKQIQYF